MNSRLHHKSLSDEARTAGSPSAHIHVAVSGAAFDPHVKIIHAAFQTRPTEQAPFREFWIGGGGIARI